MKDKIRSERGALDDTFMTIIAIFVSVTLLFIVPLMTLADRTDDTVQLAVSTATSEFVGNIRTKGKLTLDDYNRFYSTIQATGNTYDVEMELKILDENPGKKTMQSNYAVIGENVYYSVYTNQIESVISSTPNYYPLKEGDMVSVSVKNTNTTLSQSLKGFLYKVTGNSNYIISASAAGIVAVNSQ